MQIYSTKENCCGCGGCSNVCPKNCISMKEDEEGFIYPFVDSAVCVNCGLCKNVCPYNNLFDSEIVQPVAYALRHKDEQILKNSSSGGAFSAVAQAFCDDNYVIFGATFNEKFEVHHSYIESLNKMNKYRKSKYVQSNLGNSFTKTIRFLENQKKVLFTGTPCQIAALKFFLKKDYENLLTCDLICHGVSSNHFFNKYLGYLSEKLHSDIVKYDFRDKAKGWENSEVVVLFKSGYEYKKLSYRKDDPYMHHFLYRDGCRPSCYSCSFAKFPRQGDFTLGDLWGSEDIINKWRDNKGISVLICNTEKSQILLSDIQNFAEIEKVSLNKVIEHNKNLIQPSSLVGNRVKYIHDINTLPFAEIMRKYLKPRTIFRKVISILLSKNIKRFTKKLFKIN